VKALAVIAMLTLVVLLSAPAAVAKAKHPKKHPAKKMCGVYAKYRC
jgi:hypothetical protein